MEYLKISLAMVDKYCIMKAQEKKKEEKEKKMETIKITQNTSAVVNNGKVIYLIQNGIKTQDPLKVRYFQRMI